MYPYSVQVHLLYFNIAIKFLGPDKCHSQLLCFERRYLCKIFPKTSDMNYCYNNVNAETLTSKNESSSKSLLSISGLSNRLRKVMLEGSCFEVMVP